ncbi:MAG: amidohydrolase family protein [Oscillospiraceae bacterium]|nr:amidohydrolase family protein [Oscillospiraceae bacterium]
MKQLFQNGSIVDGSGQKPYVGDVLIEDGKIARVGMHIAGACDSVIDCTGLCVCPGLIDAHSHNDFFYDRENSVRFYRPFLEQGITTQVTGNCSFSPFGVAPGSPYSNKIGGGLFHAVQPGSFAEFKQRAKGNLYVNMVPLIGHGTVRASLTGYDPAPLTPEQIAQEIKLVDEAMEGGAFGGSFGFMYEPSIYAKKDELYAFASEIANYDGIVTVHPRACSKVALGYPLLFSRPHIEIALDEVIDIMAHAKCRMEYSHLIFTGTSSWPSCDRMLRKFHEYNKNGYHIAYDNYSFCYGASVITLAMPPWYLALPETERKKSATLKKLRMVIWATEKLLGLDFSDFIIAYISDEHKEYEGRIISEVAKEEGLSDFDMYLKLVELSHAQGRIYIGKYYNDDLVRRLMEDDLSIFMTDAWVEEAGTQNGSAFQCFPYFFVRAREYGIPVESVVRKMTGATADRFGIKGRGYLKPGYSADLTILDFDHMKVDINKPDFHPEGVRFVYVNGKSVVEDGVFRDEKAGEVILK